MNGAEEVEYDGKTTTVDALLKNYWRHAELISFLSDVSGDTFKLSLDDYRRLPAITIEAIRLFQNVRADEREEQRKKNTHG